MDRDYQLLSEAISAIGQCCHILGAEQTNHIIAQLDEARHQTTSRSTP